MLNEGRIAFDRSLRSFQRVIVDVIAARITEPRRFIQMVIGPRQTGKITAMRQTMEKVGVPFRWEPSLAQEGEREHISLAFRFIN